MDSTPPLYTHHPVGAIYHDSSVTFTVWAPHATSAQLILNEDTTVDLEKQSFGYWVSEVPEAKPGDLYYYRVDDQEPRPDPASLAQPSGGARPLAGD